MKREIKFRGKTYSGEWVYGDLKRVNDNRRGGEFYYIWVDTNDVEDEGKYVRIDSETVGQFTGLKDKNGKDIYEGDIGLHGESKRFVEYRWSNFTLTDMGKNNTILLSFSPDFKIIDNIHDNPEFLKGGSDE
ncbi:hypothetical protein FKG96_09975 [Olivibacter sp. LS-1]|uniref:YopX family protein n=1 Tax=Olivibacter sp. LS-1 TaxID=2592345 RepID=UPI0011EAC28D|nr:YopX family protein [Olivibacter sp. LS-1]QEL01121.1 hypothetical protein FKG96_09975 [Olivibacter sp. LS-1]